MRRILIVDESDLLIRILTKDCFSEDVVRSCADGNTALNMLTRFHPEILLINMSLPYKDGLSVLREASYLPRQVIAFSYLTNPYVVKTLSLLGVQYILHMPTSGGVRQALRAIQCAQTGIRADLRQIVTEHLQRLGIPTNMDGYKMLTVGLPLFYTDPTQPLGKELYPAIACALGQGNEQTVERSIRQAITRGWECRNDSVWEQYFTRNAGGQISCPTNKKFLTVLVRRLQQELEK